MFQKKWRKQFGSVYLYKHVGQLSWKNGKEDLGMLICTVSAWNEFFFGASKILVTGPNGIMVAHKFCDIFFYEKKTSDINI